MFHAYSFCCLSARDSYGPLVGSLKPTDALNASFWHKLTEVFEADDDAFQLWNTRLSRGGAVTACDDDCKTTSICDMRALRAENNCVSTTFAIKYGGLNRDRAIRTLRLPEWPSGRGVARAGLRMSRTIVRARGLRISSRASGCRFRPGRYALALHIDVLTIMSS